MIVQNYACQLVPFSVNRYCEVGHFLWRHGCPSCERVSDDSPSGREMRTSGGIPDISLEFTGPLQSGPAHAAWEDRELGLVAVGVGAGVAYADVEHH